MSTEKYAKQDEQLYYHIERLQQGHTESYGEIYNLSGRYLYKIIFDVVKDHHTTEDMLQETFLRIYNNIGSLKSPKAYYVWAGRIATNLCIRHLQKYRKEMLQTATDDGEGNETFIFDTVAEDNEMFIPETVMDNKEHQKLIGEIIDKLSPEQKLAVQCFYFEEMSVKEIAALMECSEGTIKSRLNYARKSIKEAVLDIEKKDGTKLYSLGGMPILLLLFRMEAQAAVGASATAAVGAALSEQIATGSGVATAKAAGSVVASEATASVTTAAGSALAGGATAMASAATTSAVSTATTAVVAKTISGKVVALIIAAILTAGGVGAAYFAIGGKDNKKEDKTDDKEYTWQDIYVENESSDDKTQDDEVVKEETEDGEAEQNKVGDYIIPEGGRYVVASTGEVLEAGDRMPANLEYMDIYYYGDYKYFYQEDSLGWCANLNVEDYTTRTTFGPILENIAGRDIESVASLFAGCKELEESPEIPSGVTNMKHTFLDCNNLKKAPKIPEGVTNMYGTFANCNALEKAPEIPSSVTNMAFAFASCMTIKNAPKIPESVTDMDNTFNNCYALEEAPEIPEGVTILRGTFIECWSIKKASKIPEGVTNLDDTFNGCKSLEEAPVIPSSVVSMRGTFCECHMLKEAPKIPEGVTDLSRAFFCCCELEEAPAIPSSVSNMEETFEGCTKLNNAS